MTRICSTCGETKAIEEFAVDRSKPSGRRSKCRPCQRVYWTRWREANAEKHRATVRAYRKRKGPRNLDEQRRRLYGLAPGEAQTILDRQHGCCPLCGREIRLDTGQVATHACVDHDHETGRVRGLLCRKCNAGMGLLGDSPERLEAAARYLRAATA